MRDAFPADDWEKGHYGKAFVSAPFRSRDYGLFGFFAGVRNYANCEPLDLPRGLPVGCDLTGGCSVIDELEVVADLHIQNTETLIHHFHSYSWFLLSELLSFDYEKVFWNRRIQRGKDGAALAQEGGSPPKLSRVFGAGLLWCLGYNENPWGAEPYSGGLCFGTRKGVWTKLQTSPLMFHRPFHP